jgi:serine/threonine-protein kinase
VLPSATPLGLRRLLKRCLNKDPKDRVQAIGDARVEIGELLSGVTERVTVTPIVPPSPSWRRTILVVIIVFIAALVTGVTGWFAAQSTVARPLVSRLLIIPPSNAPLSIDDVSPDVAMTPDGSRLVYVGANRTTLFVRSLDQLDATPLVHGGALRDPFVSPDGQWVGFFDGGIELKKVPITGGPAVLVARVVGGGERGATWAADGTIIFATSATTTGLQRISADGGAPAVLTRPDRARGEAGHYWPEVLPGGQAVLYTVIATGGLDAAALAVLDLRTGRSTILLRGGSDAQYVTSGHLVYAAAGTLRAVRFDLARLSIVGSSIPVVPQVRTTAAGSVDAGVAANGTVAYVAGGAVRTLVWVDRQGVETSTGAPPRAYVYPRISPDGTRVVVEAYDENNEIWLWDVAHAMLTRVTAGPAANISPLWLPDGRHVVFNSNRDGRFNLFTQAVDGTGAAARLMESLNPRFPTAVGPDRRLLVLTEGSPTTGQDVMTMRLDGPPQVLPLVQTPFDERNGIVSPDGRWLAYEANDSGPFEIYVRPFPDVTRERWPISTSGGTQPLWARNGKELFYLAPDGALMRVAVTGGPAWVAGTPTKMFDGRYVVRASGNTLRNYDISADDQRFLMMKEGGSDAMGAPPQIVVVQHLDEELKRLAK